MKQYGYTVSLSQGTVQQKEDDVCVGQYWECNNINDFLLHSCMDWRVDHGAYMGRAHKGDTFVA